MLLYMILIPAVDPCHMLPEKRTGHAAIAQSKYLQYKNFRVVVFREKNIDYTGNWNYIMQETQTRLLVRVACHWTENH